MGWNAIVTKVTENRPGSMENSILDTFQILRLNKYETRETNASNYVTVCPKPNASGSRRIASVLRNDTILLY